MLFLPFRLCTLYHLLLHLVLLLPDQDTWICLFHPDFDVYSNWFRAFPFILISLDFLLLTLSPALDVCSCSLIIFLRIICWVSEWSAMSLAKSRSSTFIKFHLNPVSYLSSSSSLQSPAPIGRENLTFNTLVSFQSLHWTILILFLHLWLHIVYLCTTVAPFEWVEF